MENPPIQSISAAAKMRDNLSAEITALVVKYEQQTGLTINGLPILRTILKDRRGYKTNQMRVGVNAQLPGNGAE